MGGCRPARRCRTIAVALLSVAALARAQPRDLTELSLEELMQVEVISVAKRPQARMEVADAIYVITGDDIRRSGVRTLADALRMAPGVQVGRIDSNKWAVGIRGFESRLSRSVLVLIDGRSVYSPLFAGTFWEVQDTLLEDVERIEVIRGPGGAVWGANAFNGVINIITKTADETQGGFFTAGGGNEEQGFGGVRWGGRAGDLYYRAYAKGFNRDGNRNPFGTAFDDWWMEQQGFRADWLPTPADRVTVQGDYYLGDAGHQDAFSRYRPPFTRTVRADADLAGGNVLGRWTRVLDDGADLSLQTYYDNTFRDEPVFEDQVNTWDVDFHHRFRLPWRQRLTWGLSYRHTWDQVETVPTIRIRPSSRHDDLVTWFLQDELVLIPDLLGFIAGAKFEHNDYSGFELQPSGRLLITPSPRHTLWGAVSRGVRTPSRVEHDTVIDTAVVLPAGPPAFVRVTGGEDVESEEVLAYEVGYRVLPLQQVFLDFVLFYQDYEDLLSLEPGTPFVETPPRGPRVVAPLAIANGIDATSYGFELAADVTLTPWWSLHGAYSLLRIDLEPDPGSADVTTEVGEDASPRHQATVRSYLRLPWGLELDAIMRYVDNRPSRSLRSYVTADARLAKRLSRHLELSVVGLDLADESRTDFLGGTEVERSIYGQVRVWW